MSSNETKSPRRASGRARRGKAGRGRGKKAAALSESIDEEQNGVTNNNADSDVPELEDPDPPSVTTRSNPIRSSLRLNANADSSISSIDLMEEYVGESEKEQQSAGADDDVTEILNDIGNDSKTNVEEVTLDDDADQFQSENKMDDSPGRRSPTFNRNRDRDTEEEDNLMDDRADGSQPDSKSEEERNIDKMTIIDEINDDNRSEGGMEDTEMVSEDELPVEAKEPLDTEAVSDEELPDSSVKETEDLPETEAVSEDELPVEAEKRRRKKATQAETEAVSEDELPDGGAATDSTGKEEKSGDETKKSEGGKRKLQEGEYDPSSPTSENSQDDMPPSKKAAISDSKSSTPKPVAKKVLPELEKYWKTVKDDPADFTGWTYLLQYVDQENEIEAAREAYDAFLAHYPYCYGYWRKYADYEKRKGNNEKCEELHRIEIGCG